VEKDKSTRSLHLKSKLLKNRPNSRKPRKTTKRSRNYNESIIENRKAGDYVKDTVIDVKITLESDRDDVKKVTEIKGSRFDGPPEGESRQSRFDRPTPDEIGKRRARKFDQPADGSMVLPPPKERRRHHHNCVLVI
jgi:hypothetical protein